MIDYNAPETQTTALSMLGFTVGESNNPPKFRKNSLLNRTKQVVISRVAERSLPKREVQASKPAQNIILK